ncbi:MAG: C-terminal binding protein [Acidobacteria bacterium]|nr:C-terminal binding protein [Acidobacteriota bacterium]
MKSVIITDHVFPTIDLQKKVIEPAGFQLHEAKPICKTEDDVIERCGKADALLVQWAPITRRVLQSLPQVKCVVRYGIGVNNIDLKAAKELGVTVANVPGYCLEEVSNHAVAMILSLGRRIPQDHDQIVRGGWGIGPFRPIPAFSDLTLGLMGYGAIGRKMAAKAKVFGFHVIAFDPFAPDSAFNEGGVDRVDRDAILRTADIISLHCPLLPETQHMISRKTIAMMKPGVLLINTARGPLVKEEDLVEALKSGQMGGAGLDVFEEEPLRAGSPLRDFPNVILTSHAASVSERAIELLQIKAAEAVRDFLQGKRPESGLV